jgi:AcrR family transcriptional regulator
MPYPAVVQYDLLVDTASHLIEQHGLEGLTLQSLAKAVGIAAPSLYHHFANKTALLRAVNQATEAALGQALHSAIESQGQPQAQLKAIFQAYRAFAVAHPTTYGLLYSNSLPTLQTDPQGATQIALLLQAVMAQVVGQERSLEALRGAWALVHGFVMLELCGQFRREGDLESAFQTAIATYIQGLQA